MSPREIRLAAVVEAMAETFEAAVQHHRGPRGGQQVPFHGDFANVSPSAVRRMEWWARELREAAKDGPGLHWAIEHERLAIIALAESLPRTGATAASLVAELTRKIKERG